jgi:hypothetical protein
VTRRQRTTLVLVLLAVAAIGLRVGLALQPGLWADELFSVAIATGHSLEHPASVAEPAFGDFVEHPDARPPSYWRSYMEIGERPAGPGRVVRAVLLSDTNPPLYYLILNGWARLAGTGDAALRLFSVLWALASLPLLWSVARFLAGRKAALVALLLFSLSPVALHYSTEVRMYSMGWFLGLLMAYAAILMHRRGARPLPLILAATSAAAALLTHYFLAFVWLACLAWIVLHPGRMSRRLIAIPVVLTLALVLPWYRHLPESLAAWRVSAGWIDYPLTLTRAVTAPFLLAWSLLSGHGSWGGSIIVEVLLALLYAVLLVYVFRRGVRRVFRPGHHLAWLWLAASILGILAFDLLRGTSTATVSRYAVLGLPAAMLLAAIGIAQLPRRAVMVFLVLVCLAWSSGIRSSFSPLARPHQPFPELTAHLEFADHPPDLIIVHSIPSGVIGVARYLEAEIPIASWVVQLSLRDTREDLLRLLHARCRPALVKIHDLGEPSPAEEWLLRNAILEDSRRWRVSDHGTVAEAFQYRTFADRESAESYCSDE